MDSFSVHGRRLLEDRKMLQPSAPISTPVEGEELLSEIPYVVTTKYVLILPIIVSALFCFILCALVVSALIRCRLLCRRWRVVSEPSLHEDVERTQTAIKKIDIKALPVTRYYMDSPFAGKDCPICLAEFTDGEKVRVLPECSHIFHVDCIDRWLLSNPSCPSCRHSLLYILLKKPSAIARTAAEPVDRPQMQLSEGNESIEANHAVQSFHILGGGPTLVASLTSGFY